ncbi:hypothetical protein [Kribbella solani]|uniref:PPE domain-containing protein n=1 Tax=Kribbella solani TaxID=236067 RepID=A0A841DWE9_9ACTN|nr:hypothetical protein [Kribbella solani]MBB5981165.1 hypothetical protein [Kribbella solani]
MADYTKTSMADMLGQIQATDAGTWQSAGETWGSMAGAIKNTQENLDFAWNNTQQFRDSEVFSSINTNVTQSRQSADEWRMFAEQVGSQLTNISGTIVATRQIVEGLAPPYAQAETRKATASEQADRDAAQRDMDDIRARAANVMGVLSGLMQQAFDRVSFPHAKYGGPMTPKPTQEQPGDHNGDPSAKADGGGGAAPGNAAPGATPGEVPGEKPAANPTAPKDEKDPWDEAGKAIDVIGKGIDLTGKVPENLDKWLTLAQHAKDLTGGGTPTTTPDPSGLLPKGYPSDQPALAGGVTTTPPTFDPTRFTPPDGGSGLGGSGSGGGGLPNIDVPFGGGGGATGGGLPTGSPGASERNSSSPRAAATAGGAGAEPTLAGKPTSSTGTQQSSSPMYPPMNGAGAGAGAAGARADIRSGAAPNRQGFTVPTESTAAERLSRQGVQSELQGRTSGEQRTPSGAPPLRKRRAAKRTQRTEEVLDDELWKL